MGLLHTTSVLIRSCHLFDLGPENCVLTSPEEQDRNDFGQPLNSSETSRLQKVKSGMESADWNVSMVHIHFQQLLWVYCLGHARVEGNEWREMTEQTHWRAKQPPQVACVSADLKCRGARDTTCRHKTKDITPIDRLGERGVE